MTFPTKVFTNAERHHGRNVKALYDAGTNQMNWRNGKVVGAWEDEDGEQKDGLKIQFDNGEIQDVPMNFIEFTS